jgi:hypothetical protein
MSAEIGRDMTTLDIVARLRERPDADLMDEAADEITRLRLALLRVDQSTNLGDAQQIVRDAMKDLWRQAEDELERGKSQLRNLSLLLLYLPIFG